MRTPPPRLRTRSRRRPGLVTTGTTALAGLALAATLVSCSGTEGAGSGLTPGQQAQGTSGTTQLPASPNLDSDVALDPFTSCDTLLGWVKEQAGQRVTAYGLEGYGSSGYGVDERMEDGIANDSGGRPAASVPPTTASGQSAPAAPTVDESAKGADGETSGGSSEGTPEFSGTNNQEKDVDEPDTVKTDGTRLYAVVGDEMVVYVDLDTTPRQVGRMPLGEKGGSGHQLLLAGDRVLVLSTDSGYDYRPMPVDDVGGRSAGSTVASGPLTIVEVVDVSDSALPHVVDRVGIDGTVVSARFANDKLRVVTSSHPASFDFVTPNGRGAEEVAKAANRKIIDDSKIDDWMPHMYRFGLGQDAAEEHPLLDCASMSRPKEYAGLGVLSVVTVDPEGTVDITGNVGVMGDGETVYASSSNLYVTTNEPDEVIRRRTGVTFHTAVHKFDIANAGKAVYRASGKFDGALLNQFSMSEQGGILRAATTSGSGGTSATNGSSSQVITMREVDGELKVIGTVGGLGKDESIRSVRFIGDIGYVVTFRQTDPLYTIDLSNPEQPKVAGELKILGYSAYLHPVGDGLLLGVGQDATETGRVQGTQVQLFDVSNPAEPKAIQKVVVPDSNSEVETDHHAFLWWGADDLAVLPISRYSGGGVRPCVPDANCEAELYSQPFMGVVGFTVKPEAITEVGSIEHLGGDDVLCPTAGVCKPSGPSGPTTTFWCPPEADCAFPNVVAPEPTPPFPYTYPVQITRTLVVGDNLITLSTAGLKANDRHSFTEKAWLPLTRP